MIEFVTTINGWAWGPVMLVLLLGTGIYLSIGLRFITISSALNIKPFLGQQFGQTNPGILFIINDQNAFYSFSQNVLYT